MEKRGVGFDVILGLIILVVVLLLVIFFIVPNWGTLTEKWKDVQDKLIVKTDESGNILKSAFKRLSPEGKEELLKKYSKDIQEGCSGCDKSRINKLWSVYDAVKDGEISDAAIKEIGSSRDDVKRKLMECVSFCDDVRGLRDLISIDPDCEYINYYRIIISKIKDKLKTSYGGDEFNDFVTNLIAIKKNNKCSGLNEDIANLIGKDVTSVNTVDKTSELGKIKENKIQLESESWYKTFQDGVSLFKQEKYDEAKAKFNSVKNYNANTNLRDMFNDYKIYSDFFIYRISALKEGKCEELKNSDFFKNYVDINAKKLNDPKKIPDEYYGGKNAASKYIGIQLLYDLAECKEGSIEQFEYYDILLRLKSYGIGSGVIDKIKKKFFKYCSGFEDFKTLKNVKLDTCTKKNQNFEGKRGLFNCVFLDTKDDLPFLGDLFNTNDGDCVPCIAVQSETYNCELYGKLPLMGDVWFGFDLFGKGDNDAIVRNYCSNDICDFNVVGGCEVWGNDKMSCRNSGTESKEEKPTEVKIEEPTIAGLSCGYCKDEKSQYKSTCGDIECLAIGKELVKRGGNSCFYTGIGTNVDCRSCLSINERSCEDYTYIFVENRILGSSILDSANRAKKQCEENVCGVEGGCRWYSDKFVKVSDLFSGGVCLPSNIISLPSTSNIDIEMKISDPSKLGNKYGRYYFKTSDGKVNVIEFVDIVNKIEREWVGKNNLVGKYIDREVTVFKLNINFWDRKSRVYNPFPLVKTEGEQFLSSIPVDGKIDFNKGFGITNVSYTNRILKFKLRDLSSGTTTKTPIIKADTKTRVYYPTIIKKELKRGVELSLLKEIVDLRKVLNSFSITYIQCIEPLLSGPDDPDKARVIISSDNGNNNYYLKPGDKTEINIKGNNIGITLDKTYNCDKNSESITIDLE